ncbi:MAG: hypothetical protein HYY16_18440 [Planctomycetes bacterium]|nr:hypothetical protein [Planctomycetota bacterium]
MSPRFLRCRRFFEDPVRAVCLQAALLLGCSVTFEGVGWAVALPGLLGLVVCVCLVLLMPSESTASGESHALARAEGTMNALLLGGLLLETLARLRGWNSVVVLSAIGLAGFGALLGLAPVKGGRRHRPPRERTSDARLAAAGASLVSIPAVALTPTGHPWVAVASTAVAVGMIALASFAAARVRHETAKYRLRRIKTGGWLPWWPFSASLGALLLIVALRALSPMAARWTTVPACLLLSAVLLASLPRATRASAADRSIGPISPFSVFDSRGADIRPLFEERSELGEGTYRLLVDALAGALPFEAESLSLRPAEEGVELRVVLDGVEHVQRVLAEDDAERLAAGLHAISSPAGFFHADNDVVRVSIADGATLRVEYSSRSLPSLEDLGLAPDALECWLSLLWKNGLLVVCGPGAGTTIQASLAVRGVREDDPRAAASAARTRAVLLRGTADRVEDVPRSLGPEAAPAVRAALVQVLVRRTCSDCRKLTQPNPQVVKALGLSTAPDAYYIAPGCTTCAGTGYRGRTGLFEFASFHDGEVEGIVRSTFDEGLYKARQGLTTCEELLRVFKPRG